MSKDSSKTIFKRRPHRFVMVDKNIFETTKDKSAICLYLSLLSFADNSSGRCFPSYRAISKMTGMTSATISKSIKVLESVGLLQHSKGNSEKSNEYYVEFECTLKNEVPPTLENEEQGTLKNEEGVVQKINTNYTHLTKPTSNYIEKAKPSPQTEKDFGLEVASFMNQVEGFDQVEARKFFDHWSEPDKKGKMLKDKQKTWDTKRRINKWMDNARKWSKQDNSDMRGLSFAEQDRLRAKKNREEAENYDFQTMYLNKLAEEEEKERLKNLNTIDQNGVVLNAIR